MIKRAIIGLIVVCILASLILAIAMANRPYYADIEIEGYGVITVELDKSAAPKTVKNFVKLAKSGFYDGLTFHRIIEGFMMQGGCPNGNGTGGKLDKNGKEINIVGEFSKNGYANSISHERGVISMARSGGYPEKDYYNTASSQFFIVHQDSPHLDGSYAAFGRVISGMEIVDKVCESAKPTDSNGTIPKEAQPIIKTITIKRSN
ncbi:MAG: peptidylprolyl isomerase [Clostridia bacterium]|nr:peptidylprolyl isomerase [Clostridia bacterium]